MTSVIFFIRLYVMEYKNYLDNQPSLKGKNIIITGANSGLGFSLAKQVSYKGANVYLACRNKQRAIDAMNRIREEVKGAKLTFLEYDQSSIKSIDYFAGLLKSTKLKIDCLVLNAGVFKPTSSDKTIDNHPLTTGTNYLGEFYLIKKLDYLFKIGLIKQVIIVSSLARILAPHDYLNYLKDEKGKPAKAYFASKRMDFELAGYLKDTYNNLDVKIVHPGIALTRIVDNELHSFSKPLVKFGNLVLKLIANPSEKSSLCFFKAMNKNSKDIYYCYPGRIFHTAGMPKIRKIRKIKSDKLIAASYELLNL